MPLGAGKFGRGKPAKGLEAFGGVVGHEKGLKVLIQFARGLVVKVLLRRFLNRAVLTFDPAAGPGMGRMRSRRGQNGGHQGATGDSRYNGAKNYVKLP